MQYDMIHADRFSPSWHRQKSRVPGLLGPPMACYGEISGRRLRAGPARNSRPDRF
jgi:hypothetical protein